MKKIDVMNQLKEEINTPIILIDVGARNGTMDLRDISSSVCAYGFEPNPEEYEKLVSGETDLKRVVGVTSPAYMKLEYSPYAVGDTMGRRKFYITKGPGVCSFLLPDIEKLSELHFKGRKFPDGYAEDAFKVIKDIELEVKTLSQFLEEKRLSYVDYLKIDAEGFDYEVLEGAADRIHDIGVVKVEMCYMPFRKGQKIFSDIDILMRSKGFELVGIESVPNAVGYKERQEPIDFAPKLGFPDRYGRLLHGDAFYVNRNVHARERMIAQALVLIDRNYVDEALFILKRRVGYEDNELLEWLNSCCFHHFNARAERGGRIVILHGFSKKVFDALRGISRVLRGKKVVTGSKGDII